MRSSGIRNVAMTFFFGFFGHVLGLTGRRLSLRLDPTGREFPSPLVTVFDVPIASMRASATLTESRNFLGVCWDIGCTWRSHTVGHGHAAAMI